MPKNPQRLSHVDCENCDAHNVKGVDIDGDEVCEDCFEQMIEDGIVGDFSD